LKLPESLYRRAQRAAAQKQRPLKEVILEAVDVGLSAVPEVEASEGLPPELAAALAAMEALSHEELWTIGAEVMAQRKQQEYSRLLRKNGAGTLTAGEQRRMEQLHAEAQRIMLRKAHAYALLAKRGVKRPSLEELPSPS